MTPTARRVMEKVRQLQPDTHEQWVQMHVDLALEEAAETFKPFGDDALAASDAAVLIRSLKSPEKGPCE